MKITVTPGPRGGYLVEDEHGHEIPASGIRIDHQGARVDLLVREFRIAGVEVAHWDGLERVPVAALRAELQRRGEPLDDGRGA